MERPYAGPCALSSNEWSRVQYFILGDVCLGDARSADRGRNWCIYRARVVAETGIVNICGEYGERIPAGEKRGMLKVFQHLTQETPYKRRQTTLPECNVSKSLSLIDIKT